MVARRSRGVNRATALLALIAAVCLPCRVSAKRLPGSVEFTETGIVGEGEQEADSDTNSLRFELPEEAELASLQDLADGHLGAGTAADVFFDGPAGTRVNLISGNLVWQGHFLPHGSPHTKLGLSLTYNSQDIPEAGDEIESGLAPGWTHGFACRMRAGPWGVFEIVEADGFVNRFYSTAEERAVERDDLVDDILRSRRASGRTSGLSLPTGRRFRRMLEQDDAFLDAMRARFLGGGAGIEGVYLGQGRGHQVLFTAADGSAIRVRADGYTELFGSDGALLSVEPAAGPPLRVSRPVQEIAAVEVVGGPSLSFETDGHGSLASVSGEEGRRLSLEWRRGQLVGVSAPGGTWSFEYDDVGRLRAVRAAGAWARIRYDGDRVAAVEGPAGTSTFDYQRDASAIHTTTKGPRGQADVRFEMETRKRTVTDDGGLREVWFDRAANRPIRAGSLQLRYDAAGHIVEVSGPDGSLEVQTDGEDHPVRIVDAAGSVFELQVGAGGRLEKVVDGGGIGVAYRYDARGQLVRETIGDGRVGLHRNAWGEVERISLGTGETVYVRRDAAGRPRSFHHGSDLGMRLKWDAADRLVGLDGPDRRGVELIHGDALRIADSRGRLLVFETDAQGFLSSAERTCAALQLNVQRGPRGGLRRLATSRGWGLDVERSANRVVALREDVLGNVQFDYDEHGLARALVGPTKWTFSREGSSGRTNRITSSAGRDIRIGRDAVGRVSHLSRGGRAQYAVARDGAGRPSWVDPAQGTPVSLRRDVGGRVLHLSADGEVLLELSRDGRGRVLRASRGDEQWALSLALQGWPQRLVAPDGAVTEVRRDAAGRTTGVTDGSGMRLDVEWDSWGHMTSLGGVGTRVAIEYGLDGAPVALGTAGATEYHWTGGGVEIITAGAPARRLTLDRVGRVDDVRVGDAVVDDLSWAAGGALLAWTQGEDGFSEPSADVFGRVHSAAAGDGRRLELAYGADGLLSRWRAGGSWQLVERDARGESRSPFPCETLGEVGTLLCGRRAQRGPMARALFDANLPPPWSDTAPTGASSVIVPPVPRWAVDLQRDHAGLDWTAGLPPPPGSDLVVPEPFAGNELTIPGLLVLLGFLPDDLAEHRVMISLPAVPHRVRCPGARELRVLRDASGIAAFGPGPTVVSAEPTGRGVLLQPDGVVVGHPTPWAPIDDPFHLAQPSLEILGVATVSVAPGAVVPAHLFPGDQDPLAVPLQRALDLGRWVAPLERAVLERSVAAYEDTAGAVGLWLASDVQAVVDHRGRLRGLDVGATAVGMWNRIIVEHTLAAAVDGVAGEKPRLWLASPGMPPEAGVGLCPGFGAIWPDQTGKLRWVRGW